MTVDRTVAEAYAATYRGSGHESVAGVPAALIDAHRELAHRRRVGETLVAVTSPVGDAGPALQIVTDQAAMLIDSVTVLLHRLGVAYVALMNPVMRVRRDAEGRLLDVQSGAGAQSAESGVIDESWIHIQMLESVNRRALAEAVRLLPMVVSDARQVALDSASLANALADLARDIADDDGSRFIGPDRGDTAELLRWLGRRNPVRPVGHRKPPWAAGGRLRPARDG